MVSVAGSTATDVVVSVEARGIRVELGTLKEAEVVRPDYPLSW